MHRTGPGGSNWPINGNSVAFVGVDQNDGVDAAALGFGFDLGTGVGVGLHQKTTILDHLSCPQDPRIKIKNFQ